MNYYTFDLASTGKYGPLSAMQKAPIDILDILTEMPEVSNIKQISKSTYYRIRRQDAQAFWNNLEHKLFPETAV